MGISDSNLQKKGCVIKLTKKTKLQMSNVTIMNRASFIYLNEEQTVNRARQSNLR